MRFVNSVYNSFVIMAYLKGFKYDIFISYSRDDNTPIGNERGWVETFHDDLQNWLTKRRGLKELKIWRDTRNMKNNDVIDGSIEDAVRQSGLLFALTSRNYLKSEYCERERDLFHKYNRELHPPMMIENSFRIFNIRINNILHQEWPETLGQTSSFEMYHENDRDPIARSEGNYLKLLRKIVDAVEETLEKFPKQEARPVQTKDNGIKIFVACVAPSLNDFRQRVINEAKTNKAFVFDDIPNSLSFEDYKKTTENTVTQADFSVHLFDQYPCPYIPHQEITYPIAQCEIAFGVKTPQIIWVPSELNIHEIEEKHQKDFLENIAYGDKETKQYKFIHSTRIDFINILDQKIRAFRTTFANGVSLTPFLIDTHQKDQRYAFELGAQLSKRGIQVEFNHESRFPSKNIEMFKAGLKSVRSLILIFGLVDPEWLKERIKSAMKTLISEESTPLKAIWIFRTPGSKPLDLSEFPLFKINILDNSKTDTIDETILRQLLPGGGSHA